MPTIAERIEKLMRSPISTFELDLCDILRDIAAKVEGRVLEHVRSEGVYHPGIAQQAVNAELHGERPPTGPAIDTPTTLKCPKCGSAAIIVARNMRSTGTCTFCHYEADDAYNTFKRDAKIPPPRDRGTVVAETVIDHTLDGRKIGFGDVRKTGHPPLYWIHLDRKDHIHVRADEVAEHLRELIAAAINAERAAAAAEEREACAKVAETLYDGKCLTLLVQIGERTAAAIRARGKRE